MQSKFEGLEAHTAFPMVVMGLWSVCYNFFFFLANEAASSVSIGSIIILIISTNLEFLIILTNASAAQAVPR